MRQIWVDTHTQTHTHTHTQDNYNNPCCAARQGLITHTYASFVLNAALEGAGKLMEDNELHKAMQGRGLGTTATRAAIIEELICNRYILRDAHESIPTAKATTLLRLLRALKIDELTMAELTGECRSLSFNTMRDKIERGNLLTSHNYTLLVPVHYSGTGGSRYKQSDLPWTTTVTQYRCWW